MVVVMRFSCVCDVFCHINGVLIVVVIPHIGNAKDFAPWEEGWCICGLDCFIRSIDYVVDFECVGGCV